VVAAGELQQSLSERTVPDVAGGVPEPTSKVQCMPGHAGCRQYSCSRGAHAWRGVSRRRGLSAPTARPPAMRASGLSRAPLPHLILAPLARSPRARLHSHQHWNVTAFSPAQHAWPQRVGPTPLPAPLGRPLHTRFRVWTGLPVSATLLFHEVFKHAGAAHMSCLTASPTRPSRPRSEAWFCQFLGA